LSLVLVVAPALGAAGHACDHSHHHDVGVKIAAHSHADSQSKAGEAQTAKALLAKAGTDLPASPKSGHHDCMDCVCHGCMAILAMDSGCDATLWPRARLVAWTSNALAPASPDRLDRPPKSFASA
jgi:hypothetical protein